jgi:hypothetical protein
MTSFRTVLACCLVVFSIPAHATEVKWIDWVSSSNTNGFTANGIITSGSEKINVTYNNPQGVGFFQTGTGPDYFSKRGAPYTASSPYTSTGPNGNSNNPTPSEMIALQFAGTQTLNFSKTVENLYYSFVSMNGNGYKFSQNFDVLSYTGGNVDGAGIDDSGWYGSGGVVRVDNGDGSYSLNATGGEPHGTIFFKDTFNALTWDSLTNEYWNGFTIGVEGTDKQVGGGGPSIVPLPASLPLLLVGVGGLGFLGHRRRKNQA